MGNKTSRRLKQLNCLEMPPSEAEGSNDDIAEYAATFLQSRAWDAEVGSFLDEHCIAFVGDDNDGKIEHTRLHGEYADLVQRVLQQRFSDMGISRADAVAACNPASSMLTTRPLKKATIEQLAAREDFAIFKGMMVRRNLELEAELRQKLDEHEEKKSVTVQSHGESTGESSLEYMVSSGANDENDVLLAPPPTPAQPPSFSIDPNDMEEYEYVQDEQLRLLFAATNKILASPEVAKSKQDTSSAPLKEPPPDDSVKDGKDGKLQTRDEYLRQQRDLLISRKKMERQKQLSPGSPASETHARSSKLPSLSTVD